MNVKHAVLRAAQVSGLSAAVRRSAWRRNRLLVLCYHGVSLRDEHEADPGLYVSPEFLRDRLRRVAEGGYTVLPLGEGLRRAASGTLPHKAVAITFDDGTRDFAEVAVPILASFKMPATVYFTTYYADHPLPVFDTFLRYLLWKGRGSGGDVAGAVGADADGPSGPVPVATEEQRTAAWHALYGYARAHQLDAEAKDAILRRVAAALGLNYAALVATGMYQQMTAEQVAALPRDLIDVQLHTHRHRTPRDEALFTREILDNRASIERRTGGGPTTHFCYPSGDYWGEFLPWLTSLGVESATTCVPGLVGPDAHPLLLPRFVDTSHISATLFESWLSGVAEFLPRRRMYRLSAERLQSAGAGPAR